MELHIVRPLQMSMHEVVWIELNSDAGNFVIQSNHAPMLLVLLPGKEITFRLKTGKEESIAISRGIAEITRARTTIVIQE